MSKEKLFKELITEMAKDGEISSSEYTILLEKGKDLGFTQKTIDLLIKIELSDLSSKKSSDFRLKSETTAHILTMIKFTDSGQQLHEAVQY